MKSAAAGIGLAALPAWLRAGAAQGQSGTVRVAVIGTNNRGLDHIEALGGIDNAQIAYVCDVEDGALAKGVRQAAKLAGPQPKAVKDFRRILDDASVSRRHAILVRSGEGYRILDDRSLNGTSVNGREIQAAELRDGDVITLGRVELTYREV